MSVQTTCIVTETTATYFHVAIGHKTEKSCKIHVNFAKGIVVVSILAFLSFFTTYFISVIAKVLFGTTSRRPTCSLKKSTLFLYTSRPSTLQVLENVDSCEWSLINVLLSKVFRLSSFNLKQKCVQIRYRAVCVAKYD